MENERYIIDRYEYPWFVCERQSDKKMFDIHYTFFSKKAKEKDAVIFKDGKYVKDKAYQKTREELMKEKFERLKGA